MTDITDINEFLSNKKLNLETLKFEEGIKLLEQLIQSVESGGSELETLMTAYEKGNQLLAVLRAKLQGAEERLQVLSKEALSKEG